MSERLQQLNTFLEESPNDPFLKYAIASEYLKMGDEQEALNHFLRLVEQHPDYVGTYYHLGKLYVQLQQVDKAVETYQKGISIAQQQRNMHALGELKVALSYLVEDDDDDY